MRPSGAGSHRAPAAGGATSIWRRRWIRVTATILALALTAGVVLAAWTFLRLRGAPNAIPRIDFDKQTPTAMNPANTNIPGTGKQISAAPARPSVAPVANGLNFLLMGTDEAEGGVSRSDSLMLLHLNSARTKAYLISFPRDMYVDVPGYGSGKINWAFQWGGAALAKSTVEQLAGVGIDHTAQVDFEGFVGLTDLVGGVTIDNAHAFSAAGYDFPKGMIELQGDKALVFVRNRAGLPRYDLDRAANQRAVLKAILVKALRPDVLANPVKLNALLDAATSIIAVDKNFSSADITSILTSLRIGSGDDIVLMQAPISGFGSLDNGDSIDVVDTQAMAALSTAIQNDRLDAYIAKYGKGN